MKAVLSGEITSYETLGEVIKYEGTILCPGTWRGVDGNEIKYVSPAVIAEGAPTFSGTSLVDSHFDQTRAAVKGFNAAAWYQNGCIRNRGYIWDKEIIAKIVASEYPLGQSMEADVWVDDQMNALKIQGTAVAIGRANPACRPAMIDRIESVKMEMDEAQRKALLESATIIGEPKGKVVALAEEDYVVLKALAEKGKTVDTLKTDLEIVKTTLGAMKVANEVAEIARAVSEITGVDKEFKIETYCEGIADHAMKMRMLNAYKTQLAKFTPTLPSAGTVVQVKDEDLKPAALEMFGVPMETMFLGGKK